MQINTFVTQWWDESDELFTEKEGIFFFIFQGFFLSGLWKIKLCFISPEKAAGNSLFSGLQQNTNQTIKKLFFLFAAANIAYLESKWNGRVQTWQNYTQDKKNLVILVKCINKTEWRCVWYYHIGNG